MSRSIANHLRLYAPIALVMLLGSPCANSAQTPSTQTTSAQPPSTLRRDQTAVQVLTQALNAMGGSAAWAQVSDAEVAGTCGTPQSAASATAPSSSVLWTTQAKEFRYETDTVNGGPIYLSGHGNPKIASTSATTNLAFEYGQRRLPFHLPGLLLTTALNGTATYTLALIGTDLIAGVNAIHVRSIQFQGPSYIQGAQQDWWFDPGTGLPVQATYSLPSEDNSHYLHLTVNYGGWQQEGSVLVPLQFATTLEGQLVLESCTFQTVQTSQNPAPAVFDAR